MKNSYLEVVFFIERLHRLFLDNIKAELDNKQIYDINNIQALMLHNIGKGQISIGELTNRGYYLGSNVSYNLRKMIQNGYLTQESSFHDKRSIIVHLSQKGLELYDFMNEMTMRHANNLKKVGMSESKLKDTSDNLNFLENFWGKNKDTLFLNRE